MQIFKRQSLMAIIALALGVTASLASAQPQKQADQVDQLDQLVNLNDDQKQEIREMISKSDAKTEKLRAEALVHQQALRDEIGPDFDESKIRQHAKKLGKVSGDLTAESVLLQARIQDTLTDEQRATLDERVRQMQQLQQQMQQQQQGAPQPAQ